MKFEELKRNEIEKEEDFDKLKVMGKAARTAGHVVALNARKKNLKTRLLAIYDETHGNASGSAPVPPKINEDLVLGEDDTEKLNESEEDQEEDAAKEIADDITEAIIEEELPIEEVEEEEKVKEEEQYYARTGNFQIWISEGKVLEFTKLPRTLPDNLDVDTMNRVRDAIERQRIIRYKK